MPEHSWARPRRAADRVLRSKSSLRCGLYASPARALRSGGLPFDPDRNFPDHSRRFRWPRLQYTNDSPSPPAKYQDWKARHSPAA